VLKIYTILLTEKKKEWSGIVGTDDTIAAYVRNAEMTEFSGVAEAKLLKQ
jgi:hypothetical protein